MAPAKYRLCLRKGKKTEPGTDPATESSGAPNDIQHYQLRSSVSSLTLLLLFSLAYLIEDNRQIQ